MERIERTSPVSERLRKRSLSDAIRRLIAMALVDLLPTLVTEVELEQSAEPPLLLPPPAPEPEKPLTLSDLAALIRKTAETNPFVRPLADFIDGRI